jgi:hypothetical protein
VSDPTVIRRRNVLSLFQSYAESAVAAGVAPKGLEQSFAAHVEISPSMWSQIKSSRPIGDKLARQIEQLGGRPRGWLDEARDPSAVSHAEKAFMELALTAWRASNRGERKALRAALVATFTPAAAKPAVPDGSFRPAGPRAKPTT